MSLRFRRRYVCALMGCASLGAGIGVIAPSVLAASASPPALYSILTHDRFAQSPSACVTTSEIGLYGCYQAKLRAVDRQLDSTAAQILVADKPQETENPGLTPTSAADTLTVAQKTWLTFRNADCTQELLPVADGTGIGIATLGCATADGKTRLAELHHDLKELRLMDGQG